MELVPAIRSIAPADATLRWRRVGGAVTTFRIRLVEPGRIELPSLPMVMLLTTSEHGGRVRVGATVAVEAGETCAVAARTPISITWQESRELHLAFVEPAMLRMAVPLAVARDPVSNHLSAALALVTAEPRHPEQVTTAVALVHALERRLACAHASATPAAEKLGAEAVRRIARFVERNLDQALTLEVLAKVVGISRSHFARQFRASTGMTPMAYVTRARIDRAKELLAAGARGATIAVTVGFCDQSHFNRVFKREVGLTPGAFLASSGRSAPPRGDHSP